MKGRYFIIILIIELIFNIKGVGANSTDIQGVIKKLISEKEEYL